MSKLLFDCVCGHKEAVHNFDPYSAFFGCMYTILIVKPKSDSAADEPEAEVCGCDEFRPDTLKYLEDKYESRLHIRRRSRTV